MVTYADAQRRAEEWINDGVPAYRRREVRVREFDLGFVAWAVDREDVQAGDGGAARLVIARDTGAETLWPALPINDVVHAYEDAYGRPAGATPPTAPAPPGSFDDTSFLIGPPLAAMLAAEASGASGAAAAPVREQREERQEVLAERQDRAWAGSSAGRDGDGGRSAGSSAGAASDREERQDRAWAGASAERDGDGGRSAESSAGPAPEREDRAWAGASVEPSAGAEHGSADGWPRAGEPSAEEAAAARAERQERLRRGLSGDLSVSAGPSVQVAPPVPDGPPGDLPTMLSAPAPELRREPEEARREQREPWRQPEAEPEPERRAEPLAVPGPRAEDDAAAATVFIDEPLSLGEESNAASVAGAGSEPEAEADGPGSQGEGIGYVPTMLSRPVPAPAAEPTAPEPVGAAAAAGGPPPPPSSLLADADSSSRDRAARQASRQAPPPPPPSSLLGGPVPPPPSVPPKVGDDAADREADSDDGLDYAPTVRSHPAPVPAPAAARESADADADATGTDTGTGTGTGTGGGDDSDGIGLDYAPTVLSAPPVPPKAADAPSAPRPAPAEPAAPAAPAPAEPPTPVTAPPAVPASGAPTPLPVPPPGTPPRVGPGYLAVLRYRGADGSEQQVIEHSAPGLPHPEWQILQEVRRLNVPPEQVLELHTELAGCDLPGGYCARMAADAWPNVRITHTAPYGRELAARQQGVAKLLEHHTELHAHASGPEPRPPVRVPLPPVASVPRTPQPNPVQLGVELADAFGPANVYRCPPQAVARAGVPPEVASCLTQTGLPVQFGPFFWSQLEPGRPVPTLAELAAERGLDGGPEAGTYLVIGNDYGRQLCVQYGTAAIVAVDLGTAAAPAGPEQAAPRFVNSGLPQFARALAVLGRMWRLRFGLTQEQAARWTVDFQAELLAVDPPALAGPETWWSVLLEQMWDGLL